MRPLSVVTVLALILGCGGSSGPQTHPVQGKVVYKGKGIIRQLAGGTVHFQSVADPKLTAFGEIDDEGSFTMGIVHNDKNLTGVPAGKYKARVEPPTDDDGVPAPVLAPKYRDYDKSGLTFTVPVTGQIVIEVTR